MGFFRRKKKKGFSRDKFGIFKTVKGKKFYLHGGQDGNIFYFNLERKEAISKLPKHLVIKVSNGLPHVKRKRK